MSIVSQAFERWRECRAEYDDLLWSAYKRAENECNGRLLNRRGMAAGVDAVSLFMGNRVRAYAYASEELVEHWGRYPRVTFEQFERTWSQGRYEEDE